MGAKPEQQTSFKEQVGETDVSVIVSGDGQDVYPTAWKLRVILQQMDHSLSEDGQKGEQ